MFVFVPFPSDYIQTNKIELTDLYSRYFEVKTLTLQQICTTRPEGKKETISVSIGMASYQQLNIILQVTRLAYLGCDVHEYEEPNICFVKASE